MDAKNLEPGSAPGNGPDTMSLRSIAISMKRIADVLEGQEISPGLVLQVENLAYAAGMAFKAGMNRG